MGALDLDKLAPKKAFIKVEPEIKNTATMRIFRLSYGMAYASLSGLETHSVCAQFLLPLPFTHIVVA